MTPEPRPNGQALRCVRKGACMKSVYLFFTRSGTILSRLIRFFTLDEFTHVSISADASLNNFYSFVRKNPRLPLPAGFTKESAYQGYIGRHPLMKCAFCELRVSDSAYTQILERLAVMNESSDFYQYSLLGVLLCAFGWELKRRRHYFCSQFVGDLLERSGAASLPKPSGLMHPDDYLGLPELTLLYRGTVLGLVGAIHSDFSLYGFGLTGRAPQ